MANRYPDNPGSKGADGTSQDAAEAIEPLTGRLRHIGLMSFARLGEATALEAVAASGICREALQPRLSELRQLGLALDQRQHPQILAAPAGRTRAASRPWPGAGGLTSTVGDGESGSKLLSC